MDLGLLAARLHSDRCSHVLEGPQFRPACRAGMAALVEGPGVTTSAQVGLAVRTGLLDKVSQGPALEQPLAARGRALSLHTSHSSHRPPSLQEPVEREPTTRRTQAAAEGAVYF